MLQLIALTPRCAIEEAHGGHARKVSLFGDFRASGVNDIAPASDTVIPHDMDLFLATVALFQARFPSCRSMRFRPTILALKSVRLSVAFRRNPAKSR